jgi:hypothetical protein
VNIEDLPAELMRDATRILRGAKTNVFPKDSVERLWAWLQQDDGYGVITDAYDDWIVADVGSVADEFFHDDVMPDHILSPVEDDDDPINDAQRLTFSRRLLCQMSRDEDGGGYDHFNDDPNYPSSVSSTVATARAYSALSRFTYGIRRWCIRPCDPSSFTGVPAKLRAFC